MGGQGKKRQQAAQAKAASSSSPASASPVSAGNNFQAMIKEALELHDRGEKKDGDIGIQCLRQCVAKYKQAEELFPEEQNSRDLHFNLASAYSTLASRIEQTGDMEETESLLLEACRHYGICVEFGDDVEALNNWGATLSTFAGLRSKPECLDLQREAISKYQQACTLDPSDYDAASNLAEAICGLANMTDDVNEFMQLLQSGGDRYVHAISLMKYDYDRSDAMCNWGNALSTAAERLESIGQTQQSQSIYAMAVEKLSFVVEKNLGDVDARVNLGEVLASMAETSQNPPQYFQSAMEVFQKALEINRSSVDAILGLGEANLGFSRFLTKKMMQDGKPNAERAYILFVQALGLKEDATTHYNAACCCALGGEEGKCLEHLRRAIELDNSLMSDLATDKDFETMWSRPWFAALANANSDEMQQ